MKNSIIIYGPLKSPANKSQTVGR